MRVPRNTKTNLWRESLRTKYLLIFQSYKSNWWKSKAISKTQHFSLFPNMGSEILCRFLFESNEGIFERHKKTSLDGKREPKFLDATFVHFWLAGKYLRRVKNYGLWPEFDALSEYGLRNLCLFFFEKSEEIFKRHQNWFGRQTNRIFSNSHKSLCEDPKNCRSQWICRASISLQNVISY